MQLTEDYSVASRAGFVLLLLLCCGIDSGHAGQRLTNQPWQKWSNLEKLSPGARIIVKTKSRQPKRWMGLFLGYSADAIRLEREEDAQEISIARDDVWRVLDRKGRRAPWLGALIAGGVTLAITAPGWDEVPLLSLLALPAAAGGLGIGGLIASRRLVYEAPSRKSP